jgi:acetate kinase
VGAYRGARGAQAVVFTGAIGEQSAEVRARVWQGLGGSA